MLVCIRRKHQGFIEMQGTKRVLLSGPNPGARQAMKSLLETIPAVEIVELSSVNTVTDLDLVVVQDDLEKLLLIEETLRADNPCLKILVIVNTRDVGMAGDLARLNIDGVVDFACIADNLVFAVKSVLNGEVFVDPCIAGQMIKRSRRSVPPSPRGTLSHREQDVLKATAAGLTNKEMAAIMNISIKTIETYRARALEKIGVHSRAGIVRFCLDMGWFDPRSVDQKVLALREQPDQLPYDS